MSTHANNLPSRSRFLARLDRFCQSLLLSLGLLRQPYTILVGGLLFTLLSLRFRSDAVFASPFLRAFIGRGVMLAAAIGLAVAVFPLMWIALQQLFPSRRIPWRSAEAKRRVGTAVSALVVGATLGFTANVLFTLALARLYDDEILAHAQAVDRLDHFVTLHFPEDQTALTLRRREDGSYVHRAASLKQIAARAKGLLRAGEDRRQPYRVDSVDLIGRARAAVATAFGVLTGRPSVQGGSPISEQLAGLLFDIQPYREASLVARLRLKLLKVLVGTRVDDLYTRDEQVLLYLSLVSFGSFNGHEVEGLREAACAFYGVEAEALTPAQLAELIARVQSPYQYFPYQRTGESPEHFAARHKRHEARALWILEMGMKEGVLDEDEMRRAQGALFSGLRPAAELRRYLSRPGLYVIFGELGRRAPRVVRHLEVAVGVDTRAQAALDVSIAEAKDELASVVGRRADDQVVVDAVVLDESGAIRARAGLYMINGDGASQYKGEIYAEALARGHINAMEDEVLPGLSAAQALATSNNPAAESLATRVGLELYRAHLEGQGLRVTGPYPSIALGAGVDGSPLTAAAMFAKFGYASTGSIVEEPSLIVEVREVDAGRLLFAPRRRQVFAPGVCAEVRKALETCALSGTAKRLAPLAREGGLNAKTGTAAFIKDGVLVGNGGSWILVNDRRARSTVAVRVRWGSGRPFAPEGGRSAALVVYHLLPRLRALN